MKFARIKFSKDQSVRTVVIQDEQLHEIEGSMFGKWTYTGDVFSKEGSQFLAPLLPNQIIGIGLNYVSPGEGVPEEKQKLPVFFLKPPSSIIGPEESIVLPEGLNEVKFEAEVAVVIGKPAYRVEAAKSMDYIFGYTVVNDVTAPQFFHPAGHWTLGKACPTFTPLGPHIETDLDLSRVKVRSRLNGTLKQDGQLSLMIVKIPEIIASLSTYMKLVPGDVILTGAPVGAEFLKENDLIECEVEGLGVLRNSVRSASANDWRYRDV